MMCLRAAGTWLFSSFCALSARRHIATRTTQRPLLHLQDKSGLLCQINHNCHFIHTDHSTKLKPFCPYAFQIVINSPPYIHCLLWQLQAGNEWSGSLILRRRGSARTLGGSCLIILSVLFLYCDCTSHLPLLSEREWYYITFSLFCMVVVHVSTLSVSKRLKCVSG